VACGERLTVNRMIEELKSLIGADPEVRYEEPRPGEVRHSAADISEARRLLGWSPTVDFRTGLELCVAAYEGSRSKQAV
jgi:UDP-N-acetylglucosamine/UDP-N-acetyl-alpha-D-glucosaminouronate 4-epimerase